ncbi:MAG TPA: amidohydrolase [Treponema sp.]|nr:amidohydrolase [Treponema sp.]
MSQEEIRKLVEDNDTYLRKNYEHFHEYPELGSQEFKTCEYIAGELDRLGISFEKIPATSIIATIKGSKTGKTIALRGDIDALPVEEETGVPFSSKNEGVMHACGHDSHITFMLGTAKLLNELKEQIHGTVKIFFQEGEEIGAGAKKIVAAGGLNDVDTIIGLHNATTLDLGVFEVGYGIASSIGANIEIHLKKRDSLTSNLIITASQIINNVSALAAYGYPQNEQVVTVPTVVATHQENGKPVSVDISYNFRTLQESNVYIFNKSVREIAANIAETAGADVAADFWGPGVSVNNDKTCTDRAVKVIQRLYGSKAVKWGRPFMGGEDFALYQKFIPGTFIHVGAAVNEKYTVGHTNKTIVDEGVLKYGVEFLINYVFEYLNEAD